MGGAGFRLPPIGWAISNRFPEVASGADRPAWDAPDAGLDATAIQYDAFALASQITLAAGTSKSSFRILD